MTHTAFRRTALAAALAGSLAFPVAASAGILFDPDGALGPLGAIDLGVLDWGPSSLLSKGTPPARPGDIFEVYTMASLAATRDSKNNTNTPVGLGKTFEITMIAGLTDKVTTSFFVPPGPVPPPTTGVALFEVQPTEKRFFQMFYQDTVDANQITGAGFNNGRLILEATEVNAATGIFTVTFGTDQLLDQFSGDTYSGQQTIEGGGNTSNLRTSGITADPTFFLAALGSISLVTPNISENAPFTTVDPADCFDTTASAVGVGNTTAGGEACSGRTGGTGLTYGDPSRGGAVDGGYLARIGLLNAISGPDSVYQTDFSTNITGTTIPEPGTMALLSATLLGLGFSGRRRKID